MASRIYNLGTSSKRSFGAGGASRSGSNCPRCRRRGVRVQGHVQVYGKVWIERVATVYCPDCRLAQVTPAGLRKVNEGIIAMKSWEGSAAKAWTPILEFVDDSGTTCQKILKFRGS